MSRPRPPGARRRRRRPAARPSGGGRPRRLRWVFGLALLAGVAAALYAGLRPQGFLRRPPPLPQLGHDVLAAAPEATRRLLQRGLEQARQRPEDAEASGKLGMVLHSQKRYAEALAWYERAATLAPDRYDWPYLCGRAHLELGDGAAARECLERAVDLEPGFLPARLQLAERLAAAGDDDGSAALYRVAIANHPESAWSRYGMGRLWAAAGDPG